MEKKDIYEHLAKIYLDASVKDKKPPDVTQRLKNPLVISIIVVCSIAAVTFASVTYQRRHRNSEFALMVHPDLIKINFNFDPAQKEAYSISLNKLDMSGYRTLDFSARRERYNDNMKLRIEFTNSFNERAEIYVKEIPFKWQSFRVDLTDFRNVHEWSDMKSLAFVIEEWNTQEKNGVVYIDNVRFLR